MNLTYNQIIKISRAFQQAHYILKNFGNGGQWDEVVHNQQATYKYPLMWMDDLPQSLSEGAENYSFRVSFSAPVVTLKDRGTDLMSSNANEVKSDMIQCSNDFVAYWVNQTDDYYGLVLEKSVSRTTFEDLTDDKLTGCYIDITFRQNFDYNECSIPMGTPTSLPDTCAPVLIYEDGILVDTIASGGTYSYTSGGGGVASQTFNGASVTDQTSGTTKVITVKDTGGTNRGTKGTDNALALAIQIADATQTMNAVAITSQLPETAKTFVIRYANNDPVVVTTITNTAISFIGEIPDVVVPLNVSNPYKTGQTTSYVANDDGALERGMGTDFTTLDFTNPFGNTNRFTDDLGGQTYTSDIVVDWASYNQVSGTVLAFYRVPSTTSGSTWSNAMSGQPYSKNSLSNWYIPNVSEFFDLMNWGLSTPLDYAPFNISGTALGDRIWMSTTSNAATTAAITWAGAVGIAPTTKRTTCRYILVRTYTLAELGL
jgi:hypothetical protein